MVAQWLNVFLRKSDVLKIACVAQIVNIISWLQTRTRRPAQAALVLPLQAGEQPRARQRAGRAGQGAHRWRRKQYGAVPVLDVSASHDAGDRQQAPSSSSTAARPTPSSPTWSGRMRRAVNRRGLAAGRQRSQGGQHLGGAEPAGRAGHCRAVVDGKATLSLPPLSFTVLTTRAGLARHPGADATANRWHPSRRLRSAGCSTPLHAVDSTALSTHLGDAMSSSHERS